MDFRVSIDQDSKTFEQFDDMINYLREHLAAWNNFNSERLVLVEIAKVKGQAETLALHVADEVDVRALFGGQP